MNFKVSERYNSVVIKLKGNVMGGPDAAKFSQELKRLIDEDKKNVVVDLSSVKFMNSSGLGILISGLTTMRNAGGDMKLCGATDRVESLLMVTKLITVFDNFRTLDEAIAAFEKSG